MIFKLNNKVTAKRVYVPVALRKYSICYATKSILDDAAGSILFQEIRREGFVVSLAIFEIRKEVTIEVFSEEPFLDLAYILAGNPIMANLAGAGSLALIKGKYNLFYTPAGSQTISFTKGFHSVFIVKLTPFYLHKLVRQHSRVKKLIERLETSSNVGDLLPAGKIVHEFDIIKRDMLFSSKSGTALDLDLEAGVLRLLSLYEQELSRKDSAKATVNGESYIVQAVTDYIDENLNMPKLSIQLIANKLNMSVRKLERNFKRQTGMTMLELYQQEKMKKATLLITKSHEPIKAIASELGYLNVSAFIRIFKKLYGISPSAARAIANNPSLI